MTKVKKPYQPTEAELAKVDKLTRRVQERPPGPAMKLKFRDDGVLGMSFAHEDQDYAHLLLMADIGARETPFFFGLMSQLAAVGSQGKSTDEDNSNFMLSVVRGLEPRDQMESMLAAQMAAVHAASMTMARRLNHVTTLPQQEGAERALNKLARTYAAQMEALKRYRTGGRQKMTVEHVTVNAGGQAIVGNVAKGGRVADEK